MKKQYRLALGLFASVITAVLVATPSMAQSSVPAKPFNGTYQIYDLPGGTGNTIPYGINNNGVISGEFYDSTIRHSVGFIDDHGTVTRLEAPGAINTSGRKLNDSKQVIGIFYDANNVSHAFLYSDGTYNDFNYPGATLTLPHGINNAGIVVGEYQNPDNSNHGFIRYPSGQLVTFDDPDLAGDVPQDINDKGHILGRFYLYADGKFTYRWDAKKYIPPQNNGFNNEDQITGVGNFDIFGSLDGFFKANNQYYALIPPNANEVLGFDVNDSGVVIGWFLSYSAGQHGFIAIPKTK
ncbi:MAG: hypothetical protein JWO13_1978 [Acidobacteriales bacterium]|nr:hypothetical protein [Terriglobales bacterium]